MKNVDVIMGLQWGDEGKGKVVDVLSERYDIVARYQGGANAGHTVKIKDNEIILHLIPSGILHEGVKCVIGNGVAFDPYVFVEEIEYLKKVGIEVKDRLFVSERAHVVFPYHKQIDRSREKHSNKPIGTTARGIGPLYTDKYRRNGIRVGELFSDNWKERLLNQIEFHNRILEELYNDEGINPNSVIKEIEILKDRIKEYVTDTVYLLNKWNDEGKQILLEGAQGAMLDIDFGTYPYVTSSSPTTGGALTGTGLPWHSINDVIGIFKSYTTRVGKGPFPSKMDEKMENIMREKGHEYGATTGRPRNCGYLDLVALKYAVKISGVTMACMTKLDILSGMEEIPIVVGYKLDGKEIEHFPSTVSDLERVKTIKKNMKGWENDISNIRSYEDLPKEAKEYIEFVESFIGVKIGYISVSAERDGFIEI